MSSSQSVRSSPVGSISSRPLDSKVESAPTSQAGTPASGGRSIVTASLPNTPRITGHPLPGHMSMPPSLEPTPTALGPSAFFGDPEIVHVLTTDGQMLTTVSDGLNTSMRYGLEFALQPQAQQPGGARSESDSSSDGKDSRSSTRASTSNLDGRASLDPYTPESQTRPVTSSSSSSSSQSTSGVTTSQTGGDTRSDSQGSTDSLFD